MTTPSELCGIEFFRREDYRRFIKRNPMLQNTTTLRAGKFTIIVMMVSDVPSRDVVEFFDSSGREIGKFIGPDALRWSYQIRVEDIPRAN